jgi:hypothetical protein
MTPMEQLDIIKGCETIETVDEVDPSTRDLEVWPWIRHFLCIYHKMWIHVAHSIAVNVMSLDAICIM